MHYLFISAVFERLDLTENEEEKMRRNLSSGLDSLYAQLVDIDNVGSITAIFNEWMKCFSFDISQKR